MSDPAKIVEEACRRMGISQAEFARRLRIQPQRLNNWLNNRDDRGIPAKYVPALAEACDVDPAEFDADLAASWRNALKMEDASPRITEPPAAYYQHGEEEPVPLSPDAVTVAMAWSNLNDRHRGQILSMINAYFALETGNPALMELANNGEPNDQRAFNGRLEVTQVLIQDRLERNRKK